jgi:hypothetical protein
LIDVHQETATEERDSSGESLAQSQEHQESEDNPQGCCDAFEQIADLRQVDLHQLG